VSLARYLAYFDKQRVVLLMLEGIDFRIVVDVLKKL